MTDTPTHSPERQARDERINNELLLRAHYDERMGSFNCEDVLSLQADLATANARADDLQRRLGAVEARLRRGLQGLHCARLWKS